MASQNSIVSIITHSQRPLPKGIALWMVSLLLTNDGECFVPAIASGRSETEIMICAACDGVGITMHKKHCFVPLDWLEREFPQQAELYANMRKAVENATT